MTATARETLAGKAGTPELSTIRVHGTWSRIALRSLAGNLAVKVSSVSRPNIAFLCASSLRKLFTTHTARSR